MIPLSRRIRKTDGSFGGVVHTSLDTDYFAGIFTKLEMPAGGLISLNGLDGFIRFRQFQRHSDFGQNIRGGDIWQQTQSASSGTRITHGVSDGVHTGCSLIGSCPIIRCSLWWPPQWMK